VLPQRKARLAADERNGKGETERDGSAVGTVHRQIRA